MLLFKILIVLQIIFSVVSFVDGNLMGGFGWGVSVFWCILVMFNMFEFTG